LKSSIIDLISSELLAEHLKRCEFSSAGRRG
jgi:hypothetical protein